MAQCVRQRKHLTPETPNSDQQFTPTTTTYPKSINDAPSHRNRAPTLEI